MNFVQIGVFLLVMMIGSAVKTILGKRVKELQGVRGLVKVKEEFYKGRVEAKFGSGPDRIL